MDYNYVRMRDALSAGDNKAAEHYRRIYEKSQTAAAPSRRWLTVLAVILLLLAAAGGTYTILLNGSREMAQEAEATIEVSTPAVVTQPMQDKQ